MSDNLTQLKDLSNKAARSTVAVIDAVTQRGSKHINELIEAKKKGFDVILAFIIQREDCQKFKIADDIDPEYKKLLTFALKKSLKIICYDCKFLAKGIKINKKIKLIN